MYFRYPKLLSVNGRSFAQPIMPNDTEEGKALNRRVEFQFRLRDWDLVLPKAKKLLEIETGLSSH